MNYKLRARDVEEEGTERLHRVCVLAPIDFILFEWMERAESGMPVASQSDQGSNAFLSRHLKRTLA